jgi:hypothetical protein
LEHILVELAVVADLDKMQQIMDLVVADPLGQTNR